MGRAACGSERDRVCVNWQQISVGKHRGGDSVDIHVQEKILQIWSGNELIKTVVRTREGQVRKKKAWIMM